MTAQFGMFHCIIITNKTTDSKQLCNMLTKSCTIFFLIKGEDVQFSRPDITFGHYYMAVNWLSNWPRNHIAKTSHFYKDCGLSWSCWSHWWNSCSHHCSNCKRGDIPIENKASVIICDNLSQCKALKKIHLNIKIFQCLNYMIYDFIVVTLNDWCYAAVNLHEQAHYWLILRLRSAILCWHHCSP